MKLFPEFAMMVQKWSGLDKYSKLTPWEKIQYALRTAKMMKIMGQRNVHFQDVMMHLNGISTNIGHCDEQKQVKEMEYGDFKDGFASCFTKVHDDMEKARKKKERMKKIQKKKREQDEKGGKIGVMLGCDIIHDSSSSSIREKL